MRKGTFRDLWLQENTNYKRRLTAALLDLYNAYNSGSGLVLNDIDATAAEIDAAADLSYQNSLIASGAGITGGTGTVVKTAVYKQGDFFKTEYYIDLTGLESIADDGDIIGNDIATDLPAYLMQVTAAVNGTIQWGQMTCLEVPTTGADDVDLACGDEGDGVVNDDGTALTNYAALVTAGGAWTLMLTKPFIAVPSADQYLYLLSGEAVAGTYDAGKFLIEMWGI
jgi:hypothetical protein